MNSQADPCPCQDLCPSAENSKVDPGKIPGEGPATLDTPGMCLMRFPLQKSILAVEFCSSDSFLEENSLEKEISLERISLEKEKDSPEFPTAVPELCTLEVLDLDQGTTPRDPCGSQTGISVDPCGSQTGISTDPCAPQTGISTDPCGSQTGISMDPCAAQTGISQSQGTGISTDPCGTQIGIPVDPPQTGIPVAPCPSQPQEIGNSSEESRVSPRSHSRLDSGTASAVERCLSRCQRWFRPRK